MLLTTLVHRESDSNGTHHEYFTKKRPISSKDSPHINASLLDALANLIPTDVVEPFFITLAPQKDPL